jgi:hypothetical protein
MPERQKTIANGRRVRLPTIAGAKRRTIQKYGHVPEVPFSPNPHPAYDASGRRTVPPTGPTRAETEVQTRKSQDAAKGIIRSIPWALRKGTGMSAQNASLFGDPVVFALDELADVEDAIRSTAAGKYRDAAISASMAAVGLIPGSKVGKKAMKAVKKGVKRGVKSTIISGAGSPAIPRAIANSPSGGQALDAGMYDLPAGSNPRYLGQPPDRSDVSYLRYHPKKYSDRVEAALKELRKPGSPVRKQMIADIERGKKLGGMDWYNSEELRDWFVTELGKEAGDREWREFIYLMGTASPGSRVPENIANASAIRRRLATDPEYRRVMETAESIEDVRGVSRTREKGYGHMQQGTQELATSRYVQGKFGGGIEPGVSPAKSSLTKNPKPKGFTNSFLGNLRNMAADLHFTRYMGMASRHPDWLEAGDVSAGFRSGIVKKYPKAKKYFKSRTDRTGATHWGFNPKKAVEDGVVPVEEMFDYPSVWAQRPRDTEYAAFEDFITEYARANDMTPSQAQANLWLGAAERTGVDEASRGTFMEILRKRAEKTAKKRGVPTSQVLRGFITDKGLLNLSALVGAGLISQEMATQMQASKDGTAKGTIAGGGT